MEAFQGVPSSFRRREPDDEGEGYGDQQQEQQDNGADYGGYGYDQQPPQPQGRGGEPSYPSRPPPEDPLADDGKKFTGISRRKAEQLSRGDDETHRKNQRYDEVASRGGEAILEIPELEDEGKEDLSNVVSGGDMCAVRCSPCCLLTPRCARVTGGPASIDIRPFLVSCRA